MTPEEIDKLDAKIAQLEDQLEQSAEDRYRDLERDLAVTVEALREANARADEVLVRARNLLTTWRARVVRCKAENRKRDAKHWLTATKESMDAFAFLSQPRAAIDDDPSKFVFATGVSGKMARIAPPAARYFGANEDEPEEREP